MYIYIYILLCRFYLDPDTCIFCWWFYLDTNTCIFCCAGFIWTLIHGYSVVPFFFFCLEKKKIRSGNQFMYVLLCWFYLDTYTCIFCCAGFVWTLIHVCFVTPVLSGHQYMYVLSGHRYMYVLSCWFCLDTDTCMFCRAGFVWTWIHVCFAVLVLSGHRYMYVLSCRFCLDTDTCICCCAGFICALPYLFVFICCFWTKIRGQCTHSNCKTTKLFF